MAPGGACSAPFRPAGGVCRRPAWETSATLNAADGPLFGPDAERRQIRALATSAAGGQGRRMYVGIVVVALVGVSASLVVRLLARPLTPWDRHAADRT